MFTVCLYIITAIVLSLSLARDRKRTLVALNKAKKSFLTILPDFAAVLALIGVMLTFLAPASIASLIGAKSGARGMIVASVAGSATLIPGFVAFPLAGSLLERGAGTAQIAVFISTLMMVGVVTSPLEARYFGRRQTWLRNGLAYLYSFLAALAIRAVVGG